MSSTEDQPDQQPSDSASHHSWNKDEFKKRRHAFETRSSDGGPVGLSLPGTVFESVDERTRRLQEETKQQQSSSDEATSIAMRRVSSPIKPAVSIHHHESMLQQQRSISSPTLPYSPSSPWSPTLHLPLPSPLHRPHSPITDQIRRRMLADGIRSSIDGQLAPFHDSLMEDEDVCPVTGSRRSRSSNHRIGEETGQKECDVHYADPVSSQQPSSQILSHGNQLDNEPETEHDHEDTTLSRQIDLLTVQNQQLQQQLKVREEERDRLQEQLETQRQDRNIRNAYSPSGLPSRVLDGRKVLRDSGMPKSATPTSPVPISPHSRSSPIARGYASPGSVDSQQKRFDFSSGVATKLSNVERDIMVSQLDTLKRSNLELERRLHEVLEENRKLESELSHQSEAFVKIQEREQDLSKDIETLRDENSHHTGAINKLQSERETLRSENVSLHSELTAVSEKLNKTEKCYKEVEGENLSLEAEIDQLMRDKKKLFEEKQNLQSAVEDALKTKENYRSTIKQLREQNCVLESQLKDPSARKPVPPVKPDIEQLRRAPATKEQQTLSEVLSLRVEKSQLKGKLHTAQQDVDSLKAQLEETTSTELRDEISAHLLDFQTRVALVYKDLESARRAVSTLSNQQQAMVHESFTLLAEKCRDHLSAAQMDKTKMADALRLTQNSLDKMEEDFEHLKLENTKLNSQRSSVSTDVTKLRQEIASLQDQKRLLSVQLSQNETLAQERDQKVKELEGENKKLQVRFTTTERNWKNEFVKLERDWEGRLAEAELSLEMLSEEKDSLLRNKDDLESQLAKLQQGEDSQAEVVKKEMEIQCAAMGANIEELKVMMNEKERLMSKAQEGVARLLVEKACVSAQMRVEQDNHHSRLQALKDEHFSTIEATATENRKLRESVSTLESDKTHLREQLALISEKEAQIGLLTTQVDLLEREKGKLQNEVDVLNKNHTTTLRDFHKLAETEQKRQLDNDKLKMTLTTEIELLKSKLKSVEEDKHKLEDKILDMGTDRAINSSAFQAIPQNKQVEQLKKQIVALQQETKQRRRTAQESSSSWTQLAELRGRLAALEAENKHLKETSRNSRDMIDVTVSLRKQVTEMSRKTFFLESEKKQLSEKNHVLQNGLKVAREMKDRIATERVQKLHGENQNLQDRVRILEGNLTKKLMAADLKIAETMKENDKLRQKLGKITSVLDSHTEQASSLDVLAKQLRSEFQLLQQMKTSLSASRSELEKLETSVDRAQAIHTDIQQMTSVQQESGRRSATPTRSASPVSLTLPPVLKSLPPSYLSNLQGTPSLSISPQLYNTGLHDRISELSDVNASLSQTLKEHQSTVVVGEKDVELLQQRFATLEMRLSEAVKHNTLLCESVSSAHEFELRPEQLQVVMLLQKQIENLQDQVIDRDVALQDIDLQMKKDYEMHDKKFANLKSQVLELREQLSSKGDMLRSKDQYIQKMEERYLECEGQLFKARKEMEQFVAQGLPESMQIAGVTNVGDAIRLQDEELRQLRKVLNEFTFEITQLNSQLELIHREKGALQSKSIETERMHIQMKEALSAEISYLRQLNLQLIEQHMKTEKATEILKEVKEAQDILRKQKERNKLEAELDSTNLKLHEQNRKISDLERQLAGQDLTIKLLRTEKDHALLLTQHTQDMTNSIPRSTAYRPRSAGSAGSARQPNYRISDFKARIVSSGRNILLESEFSIPLPAHNSSQGMGKVDILNLEEQPSTSKAHMPLTLGPMVVTDDESSTVHDHEGKPSKHQRLQKLRIRGHRRTASTGSNIIPYPNEPSVSVVSSLPPVHTAIPPTKQKAPKYPPHRPGSAGSTTRTDVQTVTAESQSQSQSPDHITESARGLSKYMNTLIGVSASPEETEDVQLKNVEESLDYKSSTSTSGMLRTGRVISQGAVPGTTSGGSVGQLTVKSKHKYSEMTRSKPANKSTDSNETTSSEGANSEKSSSSDQSRDKMIVGEDTRDQKIGCSQDGACRPEITDPTNQKPVNRTESMSSTCSTVFSSLLPSRTQSFSVYDGGESSPYSHESASLEIGDSVENLQTFSRLGYNPYMMPIPNPKLESMTSSSDEDLSRQDYGRLGRRKRSSGTGNEGSHDTPRHKDMSDHSNSSCDSDQLQQHGSYHGDKNQRGGIPLHRNESISISDMEKYPTDVEMEQKAKDLHQRFGRVRYSSTGSMKICYSESSNTSLEDITKH